MLHVLVAVAFVLPLGLDTFALSTALGVAGISTRERLRAALVMTAFEGVMPVVGFLIGAGIGQAFSRVSNYLAAAVLLAAGIYLLWPWDDAGEAGRVALLERLRGPALIGLGLSISMDELAIGFGGGLLRLALLPLVLIIACQAFVAAQIGMRLGARLGSEAGEWAERAAGVLLLIAAVLAVAEGAA